MNEITLLFQLCLEERYYPTIFKTAILFALSKLENRPKYLSQSYHFIALLFCLKKVLKKIIDQRLGDIALKFRLVNSAYFDTILGRSVVDLAYTLTYNVKRAWEKKKVLTALTFDIKRAFDIVIEIRLTNVYESKIFFYPLFDRQFFFL